MESRVIDKIDNWINETNKEYAGARISCARFENVFSGFYPPETLKDAYFVVADSVPKPDYPELRSLGFGNFIDMPVRGITYKNTYYITRGEECDLQLHFHELVHVVQWEQLGASNFISRYMQEILNHGYDEAPLEKMAYSLDRHYAAGRMKMDIPSFVASNL